MSDWTHDFHDFSRNVSEIDGDHDKFDFLLVSHDYRVERPKGSWQVSIKNAVFRTQQSTVYKVVLYDVNDGVIKSKWLPRGVYENKFTLYDTLATELKHYVWKNVFTHEDLTSELIESVMVEERSVNSDLTYIRNLTPHGLTSALQSVIWNRMLEKEINVVDLWKLTLYGLNHVNLYNSTPIAMHKTRYRENVENGFQPYFRKENLKESMERYFQPYRGNPTEVWLFRDKSQNQEFFKKYQPIFEFRTTDDNRTEWRWHFKHFGWTHGMRVWLSVSKQLAALLRLDEMVSLSNGRIEKSFWADDY